VNVLVDTSVWSLLLRHKPTTDNVLQMQKLKTIVTELIHTQQIRLMGSIRQELLSGVVHQAQFDKLVVAVSAFEDEVITYNDYICAAQRSF
jgi:predicted nucleic acid-binding protein